MELSKNVVPKLLRGDEEAELPIILGLTQLELLHGDRKPSKNNSAIEVYRCKIFDGTLSAKCIILDGDGFLAQKSDSVVLTISVQSYVSSTCNYGMAKPFLCLTAFSVLSSEKKNVRIGKKAFLKQRNRIFAGKATNFLDRYAPFLSNADLAGLDTVGDETKMAENFATVQDFLAHHAAIITLRSSRRSSLPADNYLSASQEFLTAQRERQTASLLSNAGGEGATRSTQVTQQYISTLDMALQHADTREPLTLQVLKQWHLELCGNGLNEHAGTIRTTNVRAGTTSFCPKHLVQSELTTLLSSLQILENRLIHHSQERSLGTITFGAAVFFGLIDIHPFNDGNGRLSRIAANWALRRGGLPFCINIFATQTQRGDYVNAIRKARLNTYLESHHNVGQDLTVEAFRQAGGLYPLVDLILERVSKAITEFNKLLEEKSLVAAEEAESQAARRFREKAAKGTCIICFDEKPNIATLCCGKAVHLNCIAEWLSSKDSCPTCRAELPSLPTRMMRRQDDDEEAEEDEETTSDLDTAENDEDETTTNEMEQDDTTTSEDDTTEDQVQQQVPAEHEHDTTTTTSEDDTTEEDAQDTTDQMDEDEATTTDQLQQQQHPPVCAYCRNRSAADCTNECCGRCCVLHGQYQCHRHNS